MNPRSKKKNDGAPTEPLLGVKHSINSDETGPLEQKIPKRPDSSPSDSDIPETIKSVLLVEGHPLYDKYDIYNGGKTFLGKSVENFRGIPVTTATERTTPGFFSFTCRGHYSQVETGKFGIVTTDANDRVLVRNGWHFIGKHQELARLPLPQNSDENRCRAADNIHLILTPGSAESPQYTAATIADKHNIPHSVLLPPGLTVVQSSQVTLHGVQKPADKVMKVGSTKLLNVPTDKFAVALNTPGRPAPYVITGPIYYTIKSPAKLFQNKYTEKDSKGNFVKLNMFPSKPKIKREVQAETKDHFICRYTVSGQYTLTHLERLSSGLNKFLGLRERNTPPDAKVISVPEETIYKVIADEIQGLNYDELSQLESKKDALLQKINDELKKDSTLPKATLTSFEMSRPRNEEREKLKTDTAAKTFEQTQKITMLEGEKGVIAAQFANEKEKADAAQTARLEELERDIKFAKASADAEIAKNNERVRAEKTRLAAEAKELAPARAELARADAETTKANSTAQVAKLLAAREALGDATAASHFVLEEQRL
ncbi:MAG TPA: hypothetical protein VLJ15_01865, partial [Gammaproteobacteria bacterium]|nr:hypothetical protein [Gammaproteobacteria bacterium]